MQYSLRLIVIILLCIPGILIAHTKHHSRATAPSSGQFVIIIGSDTTTVYRNNKDWLSAKLAWVCPAWPVIEDAQWIWKSRVVTSEEACHGTAITTFKREFNLPADIVNIYGVLLITADNAYTVYLNGELIGHDGIMNASGTDRSFASVEHYEIHPRPGRNELYIQSVGYIFPFNDVPTLNPAGVLFRMEIMGKKPTRTSLKGRKPDTSQVRD